MGDVGGSGRGRLQVHIRGYVRGVWLGGSPGPRLGDVGGLAGGSVQAHTLGCPGPGWSRVVSQHALGQTPQQTATAAGGTHPTGMHFCLLIAS